MQASILIVTMVSVSRPVSAPPARAPNRRAAWMRACVVAVLAGMVTGLAPAAGEDPPARVGRVSFLTGGADILVEPRTDWDPAAINLPVGSGTSLRTALQARAEVRIGSA